jgi:tetratricopeptide (TPR) repeat protein
VRLALSFGDDVRAMEDVQHLEAQARGRARRLQTLIRAGEIFRDAGRLDRAVPAWDRALRHAPEDARVLSGLGSALLSGGETARAISLLSRAISAPGDARTRAPIILELARALADGIGDVPAAISRLREIGADDARSAHARALEAAYRLRIGDRVGAELAYAQAAEAVERRSVHEEDARVVAELLAGGAKVVQLDHDSELAMRLAMAALSILPSDAAVQTLVRELGRSVGARARAGEEAPEPKTDPGLVEGTSLGNLFDEEEREPASPPDQEARAEALLARVKANPDDEEAIDGLVEVLGALGRDFELFALLQGRWEDASTEERSAMIPRQRSVLRRMAEKAEQRGATIEAQLYLDAAAALG